MAQFVQMVVCSVYYKSLIDFSLEKIEILKLCIYKIVKYLYNHIIFVYLEINDYESFQEL